MPDAAMTPMSDQIASVTKRLLTGEWRLILEHPNPAEGTAVCSPDVSREVGRRLSTVTPAEVGGLVDAQTEARAIALDVFANAVDSDDDSHSMDMPVAIDIIATALAAKDAELERRDMQLEASAKVALDLSAQLAEANKALEPFADIADLIDSETEGMSETDELALHFHDYLMASWPVSLFRAARRAREQGGE